ncbi:MAG: hypothetical protein FJ125_06955 [Deltaproteobacteria bacterium]|nr:hypothetical protein [Deltaproteobacteria bacterium]
MSKRPALLVRHGEALLCGAFLLGLLTGGCSDPAGNQPPTFFTIHHQVFEVGVAHNPVVVVATDKDGDPLSYSMKVTLFVDVAAKTEHFHWRKPGDRLPAMMSFTSDPGQGVLTWAPLASQVGTHEITFIVSDGRATDQEKITVQVTAGSDGGGAPAFLTPSSYVLQLVQSDSITATVAVKDEDSVRVDLSLVNKPEGMTFKIVSEDGKRGEFSWRPTQAQIGAKTIYGFHAVAVDDGGLRTEQLIRIVIRIKDGGGPPPECEGMGEIPHIEHTPLRDQFGRASYPLNARVTDDGSIERVFAAFTTTNPQDLHSFQGTELHPAAAGSSEYVGALPNLTAPDGEDVTYYYYLCAVDDDDPNGEKCDHFWCIPEEAVFTFVAHAQGGQEGCADDAREPNDTRQSAVAVDPGSLPDLWLCPDDEDWFSVQARAGTVLSASILFSTAQGDLALELHAPDGSLLVASATGSDLEEVSMVVPADGVYLLRVLGTFPPGSDGNGYALSLELRGGGGGCAPDAGEPNEDQEQATPLQPGSSGPYTICDGDIDVYRFAVRAGDEIEVQVRFTHRDGDLEALLLDERGATLASGSSADNDEEMQARAATDATWSLAVWGWHGAVNSYHLELGISGGGSCVDWQQEPNDSRDQATLLEGELRGAICNSAAVDDVDYYRLQLPAFTGLRLQARFAQQVGDLDMLLLDDQDRLLHWGDSTSDDELIEFPGLRSAATLLVEVYGYEGAENEYSLRAETIAFPQQCLPDQAEPNGDAVHAALLRVGAEPLELPGFSLCADEQDWYAIDVAEGKTLLAGIDFTPERGILDVTLLRRETVIDRDDGDRGSKTLLGEQLAQGRYLLQVAGRAGLSNLYTLQVMVE